MCSRREESPERSEGGALRRGSPQRSRSSATREGDVYLGAVSLFADSRVSRVVDSLCRTLSP